MRCSARYQSAVAARHPHSTGLAKYNGEFYYLWDELAAAALLDPKIITKERELYVDVDLNRGPNYGDTLTWTQDDKPERQLPYRACARGSRRLTLL